MATLTIRSLPEETHRALKARAAEHGRSTEAEVRDILDQAVRPEGRLKIGSALAAFGQRHGGIEMDLDRDPGSTDTPTFE
jgi:plasmid stability protein